MEIENIVKFFSVYAFILIFIVIIQFALYIWVVVWIYKVSKDKTCTCARNWRRLYIIIFPIISFLLIIPFNLLPKKTFGTFIKIAQFPEFIGWILFVVFAFQYIQGLKRMNCECAIKNNTGDNALLAMSIMYPVLIVLSLVGMVAIFLVVNIVFADKFHPA